MQATNSATAPHVRALWLAAPDMAQADKPLMLKPETPRCSWVQLLAEKKRMPVPMSKPMSPTRTVKKAFNAARELASSSHQWPISMNEQRPMISQPRMSCTMLGASTMHNMPAENKVRAAKKCV